MPYLTKPVLEAIAWLGAQAREKGIEGSFGWPSWERDPDHRDDPDWVSTMKATPPGADLG